MTIDKFDLNIVLVNINKLKPYRFVKDQTFQLILVKLSDLLLEELIEIGQSSNLFIDKLVETNHFGNLLIKDRVKSHNEGIIINKHVKI
jgi:hypothetical protein